MAARYAPLFVVSRFQAELDRLFQEARQLGETTLPAGAWTPALDVVESPESVVILVELPGLGPDDVHVEVRGTTVAIAGSKPTPQVEAEQVRFHCMERGQGRFTREIHLMTAVNTHQGKATLSEGLLTVEFPKIEDKRREARVLQVEDCERNSE
jgi:HSP20 family protein